MEWLATIAILALGILAILGHVTWLAPLIAAMVAAFFWVLAWSSNSPFG